MDRGLHDPVRLHDREAYGRPQAADRTGTTAEPGAIPYLLLCAYNLADAALASEASGQRGHSLKCARIARRKRA